MAVSVSEKPWSDYTKADYTPEQWHAACIIHQHTGPVTSKNQCKLPVRTPTGTLNRNGVHAAAAALAGARGGVDASNSDKFAARRQLVAFYKQLGEEPPPSLSHSALDDFLAHYGVKGMLWGVRRGNLGVTRLDSRSDGAVKTVALNRKAAKDPGGSDAFKTAYSTSKVAKAINDSYADPTSPVQKFNQKWQKSGKASDPSQRDSYDKQYAKVLTKEANSNLASGSKAKVFVVRKSDGTTQVHMVISRTIRDRSARKNYQQGLVGDPTTEAVHADSNEETVIFAAILDKNGLIIGLKPVEEGNVSHTSVEDFLAHHGIKGMKWGVRRGDGGGSGLKRGGGDKSASDSGSSDGGSGSASGTHLSADAERFLNTRSKTSAEMSDREIKEANARADALKKYNATFNDPNAELRAKVEGLQLQKSYAQMQREMNPTKMQQVAKFAGSAKKGYDFYQKANEDSGGKLNSLIGRAIGIKPKPETEGQRLAREVGFLKVKKEHEDLLTGLASVNTAPVPRHSSAITVGRHMKP